MDKPEPFAWCIVENGRVHCLVKTKPAVTNAEKWQPLYTAPPQRDDTPAKAVKWQGLTDEDIEELDNIPERPNEKDVWDFARTIEAKLKEKNNG